MTDGELIDWEAVRKLLDAEEFEDGERRVFIGTVFTLTPSGKYHAPWAGAPSEDEEWYERITEEALSRGLYLESGEGDPCDLYIAEYEGV
jgi:hypothetical protein